MLSARWLHPLRYFHIDHKKVYADELLIRHFYKVLCILQKDVSDKHFQQFFNQLMKEKENKFGQSVLKVIIVLQLGKFTLISEKRMS